MHIEGMAADIDMQGVDGKTLWEFVRSLDCCGAGYYHAKGIHVDVGPSRFWDETSTKVEQDLGARNKLVIVRTNFDYFEPKDTVYMTFARVSDYPIGIRPDIRLETVKGKEVAKAKIDTEGPEGRKGLPDPAEPGVVCARGSSTCRRRSRRTTGSRSGSTSAKKLSPKCRTRSSPTPFPFVRARGFRSKMIINDGKGVHFNPLRSGKTCPCPHFKKVLRKEIDL
jgi:hypothetical protein